MTLENIEMLSNPETMPRESIRQQSSQLEQRARTDPAACYNEAMPSETEKQRALEVLHSLPDNATIEEAIERLCFIAKIKEGLRQSEAGRVVKHEEVKKRFLS